MIFSESIERNNMTDISPLPGSSRITVPLAGANCPSSPLLEVSHLSVTLGQKRILEDVSFALSPGEWLMLIGPNGAGKSTLVNAISQAIPCRGAVKIMGKKAEAYSSRALARKVGVLSQNHFVGYGFTVEEVIRLGQYSHSDGYFSSRRADSEDLVQESIRMTGMEPYLSHSVLTLSGGELQRAFLAQLFVQDPQILILDEPANHLDLVYQKQVFSLIREWLQKPGRAVISVVHDLSCARCFGSRILLLDRGHVAGLGIAEEVMKPSVLNAVYEMDVREWMNSMYQQWT